MWKSKILFVSIVRQALWQPDSCSFVRQRNIRMVDRDHVGSDSTAQTDPEAELILPTVPSCHRILATHGTLPHLLLIHFITLHCYLPSCCDLYTVTATWMPPLLSDNTRGCRIRTTQVLSIQAFVTGRPRATEWSGVLLQSGFVRKLPKGHWPSSISGQHAKRWETRGHF